MSFQTSLCESLGLASPLEANIKYEDEEGDMVTLRTDSDLVEMLRQVVISDDNLLRLVIESTTAKKSCPRGPRSCPGMGGHPLAGLMEQLKCGLPDLLENPNIRSMAEGLLQNSGMVKIVSNHICDSCEGQICGDRFRSSTQDNFDLCSTCMRSSVGMQLESIHKFEKISALQAFIDCMKKGGSFEAAYEQGDPSIPRAHSATCDLCSETIRGIRHKCLDCADYDECDECRTSVSSHNEHEFYVMADPSVRRIPAEILAERAAQMSLMAQKEAEVAEQAALAAKQQAEQVLRDAEEKSRKIAEESRLRKESRRVVTKPKPTPAPAPSAPETKAPSAFEQNLQTLESMGFSQRKECIAALVRNRNKLFETIQELLQNSK